MPSRDRMGGCTACGMTTCGGMNMYSEAGCMNPLVARLREQEERIRKLEDYVLGLQDVFVHAESVGENKTD